MHWPLFWDKSGEQTGDFYSFLICLRWLPKSRKRRDPCTLAQCSTKPHFWREISDHLLLVFFFFLTSFLFLDFCNHFASFCWWKSTNNLQMLSIVFKLISWRNRTGERTSDRRISSQLHYHHYHSLVKHIWIAENVHPASRAFSYGTYDKAKRDKRGSACRVKM